MSFLLQPYHRNFRIYGVAVVPESGVGITRQQNRFLHFLMSVKILFDTFKAKSFLVNHTHVHQIHLTLLNVHIQHSYNVFLLEEVSIFFIVLKMLFHNCLSCRLLIFFLHNFSSKFFPFPCLCSKHYVSIFFISLWYIFLSLCFTFAGCLVLYLYVCSVGNP